MTCQCHFTDRYTVIMPNHHIYTVICLEGLEPKNLLMARENLQFLFDRGGKPKGAHLAGGKIHLTLYFIVLFIVLCSIISNTKLPSWSNNSCGYDILLILYFLVNDLVHLSKSDHH